MRVTVYTASSRGRDSSSAVHRTSRKVESHQTRGEKGKVGARSQTKGVRHVIAQAVGLADKTIIVSGFQDRLRLAGTCGRSRGDKQNSQDQGCKHTLQSCTAFLCLNWDVFIIA